MNNKCCSNYLAQFEIFLKILEVSNFPIGLYNIRMAVFAIRSANLVPMGKSLTSRIFIKSVIAQKNLKLCMMITTTIRIVQKITVAIATENAKK